MGAQKRKVVIASRKQEVLDAADAAGVIFVAAAGNSADDTDRFPHSFWDLESSRAKPTGPA